jgi:hypothetical protein
MSAEIKETQKHHHVIYNLNTLETTLLCSAVVVLTAGIIFDSDYIWLPEFRISRAVITYGIVALIAASLVYYMLLTIREIRLATEKRKLRRKVRYGPTTKESPVSCSHFLFFFLLSSSFFFFPVTLCFRSSFFRSSFVQMAQTKKSHENCSQYNETTRRGEIKIDC